MLPRQPSSRRFPLHTLVLMLVALALFIRLWWITHERRASDGRSQAVDVLSDHALVHDAGVDAGTPQP